MVAKSNIEVAKKVQKFGIMDFESTVASKVTKKSENVST